jgi:GDPmannose 4,6-dehydratase
MTDGTNLTRLIQQIKPDEIYNLAAMMWLFPLKTPEYGNADGWELTYFRYQLLMGLEKRHIYQASTSEVVW